MKITFLDAATLGSDVSLDPIARLGELVCWQTSSPEEALARVSDCDVLIVNKVRVTPQLIDAGANLRLICEAATGVNNIDIEYAASKGIPVRNICGIERYSCQECCRVFHRIRSPEYFHAYAESYRTSAIL